MKTRHSRRISLPCRWVKPVEMSGKKGKKTRLSKQWGCRTGECSTDCYLRLMRFCKGQRELGRAQPIAGSSHFLCLGLRGGGNVQTEMLQWGSTCTFLAATGSVCISNETSLLLVNFQCNLKELKSIQFNWLAQVEFGFKHCDPNTPKVWISERHEET